MKPEIMAVRAVNQYRRRDMLAYLGLRYYLENEAPKQDLWAKNVSAYLVNTRKAPAYFHSYHFKEFGNQDRVVYRDIHIPGPNEILAETDLLHECSLYPSFKSLPCVYSYHFPEMQSKEGVFSSYFPKYISRHQSIADVCRGLSNVVVRYTDIKKYYPSISKDAARNAWRKACESSKISSTARELGERLLEDHTKVADEQGKDSGVLTGPMFSHLIANLVLFDVDKIMQEKMKNRYWRYVDDIVLVGESDQVDDGRKFLKSVLNDLGLSLHEEGKDFAVDSKTWLEGVDDFSDSEGKMWMNLISNIKRFLVAKPELKESLAKAFLDNGINIPLLDYSVAVLEASFVEKFNDLLMRYSWFPKTIRNLSVNELVDDALKARTVYQEKIKSILDGNSQMEGYQRKRILPKLRFYAGRLFYLAAPESLSNVGDSLANYPEMLLESAVMNAIQTRDVGPLLKFGSNAVQAAAQIFRLGENSVTCTLDSLDDAEVQGMALLRLNGIDVNFSGVLSKRLADDELNQFAVGDNLLGLMKSSDPFVRELACLRGVENLLRHQAMLSTAFDRDEQLVFDISQLRDSSYF